MINSAAIDSAVNFRNGRASSIGRRGVSPPKDARSVSSLNASNGAKSSVRPPHDSHYSNRGAGADASTDKHPWEHREPSVGRDGARANFLSGRLAAMLPPFAAAAVVASMSRSADSERNNGRSHHRYYDENYSGSQGSSAGLVGAYEPAATIAGRGESRGRPLETSVFNADRKPNYGIVASGMFLLKIMSRPSMRDCKTIVFCLRLHVHVYIMSTTVQTLCRVVRAFA